MLPIASPGCLAHIRVAAWRAFSSLGYGRLPVFWHLRASLISQYLYRSGRGPLPLNPPLYFQALQVIVNGRPPLANRLGNLLDGWRIAIAELVGFDVGEDAVFDRVS